MEITDTENAESQARSARTDESRLGQSANYSRRQTRIGAASCNSRNFSGGIVRAVGTWADSSLNIRTGGILDQLIEQAQGQLVEAEKGIAWHQKGLALHQSKKEQALVQIEELRQLKELKQQTLETDDRGESPPNTI